jgi:hypothetical protein
MNIYYNEFLPSNSTDSFINWINENKKEYYNNMEEYDDVLELIYDNNNKSINLIDNLKQS